MYTLNFSEFEAIPMTLYEYNLDKDVNNHLENRWRKGYKCDFKVFTIWLDENDFNKIIK